MYHYLDFPHDVAATASAADAATVAVTAAAA